MAAWSRFEGEAMGDEERGTEIEVAVQIAPAFATSELAQSAILSEARLRGVAEAVLRHEGAGGEVTLVISDDEGIRELNRDFLGEDAPTDVLSFSAQEAAEPFVVAPVAGSYLGDVIVSYPRAAAQAQEQGHPVEMELDLLIVHGLLHLLGYDHAEEVEKDAMWARQDAILRDLGAHG
jgi:probable rRNA maturation factor